MSASYGTTISTVGAPVPIVEEPCTILSAHEVQITDDSRRLLDIGTNVILTDENEDILTVTKIDIFQGIFTIQEDISTSDVYFTGAYLTKQRVGCSKSYSLEIAGDILDDTCFDRAQLNGGYRTRKYGLHDISCQLSRWDDLSNVYLDKKINREKVFIEIVPTGSNDSFMGWFVLETNSKAGEVGGLEEESLTFSLAGIDDTETGALAQVFSFS